MKNRAKCKLCNSVIESFHRTDYISCSCGEISVAGGPDLMECGAKNWQNFLRVDELNNVIVPKIIGTETLQQNEKTEELQSPLSYKEKVEMLSTMVKNLEELPQNVMSMPINHYDFYSYMLLISNILSSPDKN